MHIEIGPLLNSTTDTHKQPSLGNFLAASSEERVRVQRHEPVALTCRRMSNTICEVFFHAFAFMSNDKRTNIAKLGVMCENQLPTKLF